MKKWGMQSTDVRRDYAESGIEQQRLVEAWAELHQPELAQDWQLLQQGRRPQPIAPLQ